MSSKGHMSSKPTGSQIRQINETIRYSMWSVFKVVISLDDVEVGRDALATEFSAFIDECEGLGVTVRGVYDVGGLRADSDFMVWWHSADIDTLQARYRAFLRTQFGRCVEPVWSNVGLHRPAEFNKGHIPAFLAGEDPKAYVCVYPFVRSYDWYVLEESERRDMLVEHGRLARTYPDVRANTIAAFALGDYEWLLAFEADDLSRIVDLMRDLRASRARLHVREEVPFFTGPQKQPHALVATLP